MKFEIQPTIPDKLQPLVYRLLPFIAEKKPQEAIRECVQEFPQAVKFSTSLGMEDQVLTDMLSKMQVMQQVDVFTLDTGRLFEETQYLLHLTIKRYGTIKVYFPDYEKVEALVNEKGSYSFYNSVEDRKECCYIRKVLPLQRALAGGQVWLTGIRAAQSVSREAMPAVEWDSSYQILKVHPLFYFSDSEIEAYVKDNSVLVNELHAKGYPSIGCAPCTRAIKPGEDIRAGRWWWEQEGAKECGLHVKKT